MDTKLSVIEEKLYDIFTPSAPISSIDCLKGREIILDDINNAYKRKGASIVIFGERGVGKTSVARVTSTIISGNHFYYSASASDTFDIITFNILRHYGVSNVLKDKSVEIKNGMKGEVKVPLIKGSLDHDQVEKSNEIPLKDITITSQEISSRLPNERGLIIIDDFERISSITEKAKFADLIKKFSDNNVAQTLMIVGISENITELLSAHESLPRSITEIKIPRLLNNQIEEIITDGLKKLDIDIEQDCIEQIIEYSAQFPYYTHLLCEGAVNSLINSIKKLHKTNFVIQQDEIQGSIKYAIRNTEHSISTAYESATRRIRESQRFKFTLYAIASWPAEPVAFDDICSWVGKITNAQTGKVDVSHQLRSLEEAHVIEKVSKGYYRFKNPVLKAYVILRARADTPKNELTAIDSHLKYIKKRIDRVALEQHK